MSKEKCCGNCKRLEYEGLDGFGWCTSTLAEVECNHYCPNHEFDNNGWTEITPDNVEDLKDIEKRVVVANRHHGSVFYRTIYDVNSLDSMAKQGGYYYFILPELRFDGTE